MKDFFPESLAKNVDVQYTQQNMVLLLFNVTNFCGSVSHISNRTPTVLTLSFPTDINNLIFSEVPVSVLRPSFPSISVLKVTCFHKSIPWEHPEWN